MHCLWVQSVYRLSRMRTAELLTFVVGALGACLRERGEAPATVTAVITVCASASSERVWFQAAVVSR